MKKVMKQTVMLALLSAHLIASDDTGSLPIGTRQPTVQEDLVIQEARALEAAAADTQEQLQVKGQLKTTHEGVYHNPWYVYPLGDMVQLNDGTLWGIAFEDRKKTFNWMQSDVVIITQNTEWFSKYEYCLKNETMDISVKAHLWEMGPDAPMAVYQIWQIDLKHKEICLSDGSVWQFPSGESDVVKSWVVGDRVVIGCNDAWFSSSNPNILINLETLKYAKSKCVY